MPKGKASLTFIFSLLILFFSDSILRGQSAKDQAVNGDLRLYIDCNFCDNNYIRENVTFVNHVRDLEEADVHVLVVNNRTGSGGDQFEFEFIGRGQFEGEGFKIKFFADADDTWDETRTVWVQKLMAGLIYFLAKDPDSNGYQITSVKTAEEKNHEIFDDPWNYWVFDIDGNGSFQTESSQSRYRVGGDISSDRVTEDWKFNSRIYFNRNTQTFETDDGEIESISEWKGGWGRIVKSMGPHFSSGFSASADASTFRNNDRSISFGPAVEYSFFPYADYTRRILTFEYTAGFRNIKYDEITIYEKTDETLLQHELEAHLQFITPTGYASIRGEFSQYLHDLSKNRIEFNGRISQRLFKGFSVNLDAGVEVIHDQLYLPKGDASLEEVLLRRRQLATTFEYNGSIGLSYTFGSIYNNVVNSRM